jgi:acyl carrier protein
LEKREQLLEVFKRHFNVSDINDLGLSFEDLRMGTIEEWDSLGNLNLLLEVENEFSVRFSTAELSSIDSLVELENYLSSRS